MEKKNTKAIEKIITELSKRDYESRCKKLTKSQIDNIRQGKKTLSDYGGYSLSQETMEAIETKNNYQNGNITEAEYKNYCLQYNLRTRQDVVTMLESLLEAYETELFDEYNHEYIDEYGNYQTEAGYEEE